MTRLRELRYKRGLQRKFVAEKIGICGKHLNDIEIGKVNLTDDVAKKLADVYAEDVENIKYMYKEGKNEEKWNSKQTSTTSWRGWFFSIWNHSKREKKSDKLSFYQRNSWIEQANRCIEDIEVGDMPKVTIVEPSITPEEEKKVLKDIANCMKEIIQTEYGTKVKVELHFKR